MPRNKDNRPTDDFEDDGRTIADMSGVERPNLFLFRPLKRGGREEPDIRSDGSGKADRPWEKTEMSRLETFRYVLGAVGAGLLIGGIFIAVFGLVIWLMVTMWT